MIIMLHMSRYCRREQEDRERWMSGWERLPDMRTWRQTETETECKIKKICFRSTLCSWVNTKSQLWRGGGGGGGGGRSTFHFPQLWMALMLNGSWPLSQCARCQSLKLGTTHHHRPPTPPNRHHQPLPSWQLKPQLLLGIAQWASLQYNRKAS